MTYPDFSFEKKLAKKGYKLVAGVDEVGRGSFAGPIVAGCVVFPQDSRFTIPDPIVINDSKKLTARRREKASEWIKENALAWAVGEISASKINSLGMAKASRMAFRKAIAKVKTDFLLIDAFYIPFVKGLRRKNQLAIVKGDTKSVSIAAASIIAKVYRDKLMTSLSKQSKFKPYRWGKNKGYGTREHQAAIKKYGTTREHRKQFVETWIENSKSSKK